jgi:hypothetical protein
MKLLSNGELGVAPAFPAEADCARKNNRYRTRDMVSKNQDRVRVYFQNRFKRAARRYRPALDAANPSLGIGNEWEILPESKGNAKFCFNETFQESRMK